MEYLFVGALILVAILSILATIFIKNKLAITILTNVIAGGLLIWKIVEFSYYIYSGSKIYPVEFSHLSYFIVGFIVLSQIKKLYFTGSVFALISGMGYMFGALINPLNMINSNSLNVIIMGFVSHSLLFFLGLLLLFKFGRYNLRDIYIPIVFFILVIIYEILVINGVFWPDLENKDSYFLVLLVEGRILEYIGVDPSNKALNYSVTALLYLTYLGMVFLMNYLNKVSYKKSKV